MPQLLSCALLCLLASAATAQESFIKERIDVFKQLKPFGYNFFTHADDITAELGVDTGKRDDNKPADQTSAISADYLVKTGDEIIIDLWGEIDLQHILVVDEDGFIKLPEIGRIYLRGDSFAGAKKKIMSKLANSYKLSINQAISGKGGTNVDITMGRITGVKVYVTGEVNKPSLITLKSSTASIVNLLKAAGGVKPRGSLREISVKRSDGEVLKLDLYRFLLSGELPSDYKYLNDGDIVFVPLKNKEIFIDGEVNRPAVYELLDKDKYSDLVAMAGGLTAQASDKGIQVFSVDKTRGVKITDYDAVNGKLEFPLQNYDMVFVPTLSNQRIEEVVKIAGDGVVKPGVYQFVKGMTVKDLVEKAGGLNPDALLKRAALVRLKQDLSKDISHIDLGKATAGEQPDNVTLNPMDQLITFSKFLLKGGDSSVTVEGHVKRPGNYPLHENLGLSDLIFIAGGFDDPVYRKETYLDRADIARFDERTQKYQMLPFDLGKLLKSGEDNGFPQLQAGDIVKVYAFTDMATARKVQIRGEVVEPGEYDLREGMSVADLVVEAGNFKPSACLSKIDVSRVNQTNRQEKMFFDIDFNDVAGKSFLLRDGDCVLVRQDPAKQDQTTASIDGEVAYPGNYILKPGETLSSLVARAGGLKPDAFPEAAALTRDKTRVVLDLPDAIERPGGDADILLFANDRFYIPKTDYSVSVVGEVLFPQKIGHAPRADAEYYVEAAGGLKETADAARVMIIMPSGKVVKASRWFWLNPEPPKGSVVFVPAQQEEKTNKQAAIHTQRIANVNKKTEVDSARAETPNVANANPNLDATWRGAPKNHSAHRNGQRDTEVDNSRADTEDTFDAELNLGFDWRTPARNNDQRDEVVDQHRKATAERTNAPPPAKSRTESR